MTSEVFVWRWHKDTAKCVLCGRLYIEGDAMRFVYRRAYRESADALPLSPHLPLGAKPIVMRTADLLPRPLADAAPDAWGRRVIECRTSQAGLDELSYLLHGQGNRIGAFEFTADTNPPNAEPTPSSLEQLLQAAESLETDRPLSPEVLAALEHGTSIGGARPKATLQDDDQFLIAKFASSQDTWPVVRAEYAGMRLAERCGIEVPAIKLMQLRSKDILLLERFDRHRTPDGVCRRQLLSALSMLDLEETEHLAASYPAVAETLRQHGHVKDAQALYSRMVFNILIGNTDDHAKNHAAFWDGSSLRLTPAYDIVPYLRVGQEASQAMIVGEHGREATLSNALSQANQFGLTGKQAAICVEELIETIRVNWIALFEEAGIPDRFIDQYGNTSILSPVALGNTKSPTSQRINR